GGWINGSPCSARGSSRKKGDASAIGWIAEQTSWRNPGSVSSADRVPPPIVTAASRTSTNRPARASATAAPSPLGPDPTTIASYRPALIPGLLAADSCYRNE